MMIKNTIKYFKLIKLIVLCFVLTNYGSQPPRTPQDMLNTYAALKVTYNSNVPPHIILELSIQDANNLDNVKKAFRRLALQWHPDKWQNNKADQEAATEVFKIINEAYVKASGNLKKRSFSSTEPTQGQASAAAAAAPAEENQQSSKRYRPTRPEPSDKVYQIINDSSQANIAMAPDGRSFASAAGVFGDNNIIIWRLNAENKWEKGQIIIRPPHLSGHAQFIRINNLAFSPDGRLLALATEKGLDLWQRSPQNQWEYQQRLFKLKSSELAFSPDSRSLIWVSSRGINIWRLNTKDKWVAHQLIKKSGYVKSITFSPDGRSFATSIRDFAGMEVFYVVIIYKLNSQNQWEPQQTHNERDPNFSVSFSPDGGLLAVGTIADRANGSITLLRRDAANKWATEQKLPAYPGIIQTIAFSPDGNSIAAGHDDPNGTIRLWRRDADNTWKLKQTFIGYDGPVKSVSFSPDGRFIVSGLKEYIIIWRAQES